MSLLRRPALLLLAGLLSMPARATDAPSPSEFSWRASLTLPAGASLTRLRLPAEALAQLQSNTAQDLRVFNAAGEAVAFAFAAPPEATAIPAPTPPYAAYPLFSTASGQRPARGSLQVRLDDAPQHQSVWVQLAGHPDAASPAATQLPAVLMDTRQATHSISTLTLQGALPANTLVHFTLASSSDLAHWTPVPLRGPLYQFEGVDAPRQLTLELQQALPLQGRYLRLDWAGQQGVRVDRVSVSPALVAPPRVRAALAPGMADGRSSLTWALDFATPLAALQLSTSRDNTLVPVRILGRNDAAQPWRVLTQTAVYQLGAAGAQTRNPPIALGGVSVRWLRVEASHGMLLPDIPLQASVEFEPREVIFLASGPPPFELAVGRPSTPGAAVALAMLGAAIRVSLADLPQAQISQVRLTPAALPDSRLQRWLPAGVPPRSALLWAVLLAAVALLAGVAYTLLRQLSATAAPASASPQAADARQPD
jgi:hypothetical protein